MLPRYFRGLVAGSVCALFSAGGLHAAEIDHFTTLNMPLSNSAAALNSKANELLLAAAARSNLPGERRCDQNRAEQVLYDNVQYFFDNHIRGSAFYDFYAHSADIERATIAVSESIYADWAVLNGLLLYGKAANDSGLGISSIVQFNELRIGIDKFEHFFDANAQLIKLHNR